MELLQITRPTIISQPPEQKSQPRIVNQNEKADIYLSDETTRKQQQQQKNN